MSHIATTILVRAGQLVMVEVFAVCLEITSCGPFPCDLTINDPALHAYCKHLLCVYGIAGTGDL